MPQRRGPPAPPTPVAASWTFLTNHAHVLFVLAQDPLARHRDVAARVGLTERAVARLIADLVEAGYVRVVRAGRRNRYALDAARPLRHPLERHRSAQDLVRLVLGAGWEAAPAAPGPAAAGPR